MAFSENHGSVTFSEEQEVYDVTPQGFSRVMSHEIAIVIMSYDSRVILLTNQKLTHKLKFWLKIWFWF